MLYAAFRKVLDFKMFRNEVIFSLANIDTRNLIFVSRFCEISVLLQCVLEFLAGFLIPAGTYKLAGLYLTFSAIVTASVYLLAVLQVNYSISIFFGGIFPGGSMAVHLIINCTLLLISLTGIHLYKKQKKQLSL